MPSLNYISVLCAVQIKSCWAMVQKEPTLHFLMLLRLIGGDGSICSGALTIRLSSRFEAWLG